MQAMHPILAEAVRRARWCGSAEAAVIEPPIMETAPEPVPVPTEDVAVWLPPWPWIESPAWRRSTCHQVRAIIQATALHYDLPATDIISCRRFDRIVLARHVAMYLAKTLTTRSLPDIARWMGNKDHTTVLHGFRRIAKRLASQAEPELSQDVAAVRAQAIKLNPTLAIAG